jgi:hypothetical protein
MVNTLPFLIAAFLLVNPLLLVVYQRLEIQLEKLQFWVMVSSGTAWMIAGTLLILNPDSQLNPVWNAGFDLLPSLAFILDKISAAMILALCGVLFYLVLVRQESPRTNALMTGLGGISVLGLLADSPYTLALFWTGLELFYFWIEFSGSRSDTISGRYLLSVLIRSAAPVILIILSLTGSPPGSGFISGWDPGTASIMIGGGLIGFLGWFIAPEGVPESGKEDPVYLFKAWIPGSLALILIVRGGTLLSGSSDPTYFLWLYSIFMLVFGLISLLLDLTSRMWFIGCGLLAAGSAISGYPLAALSWCVVFMIPGNFLRQKISPQRLGLIPLGLAGLGILPLPFMPSWAGISVFEGGGPGLLLSAGWGLYLGGLLLGILKNLPEIQPQDSQEESVPLISLLGSASLLISQLLIALLLQLVVISRGLLTRPLGIWLPAAVLLLVLVLGNWIPLQKGDFFEGFLTGIFNRFRKSFARFLRLVERLFHFLTSLLEGDGGLIWTLLLGLLLITLISLRGGR